MGGFAVQLSGNTYLTSSGALTSSLAFGTQIYRAPAGIRFDSDKVREAFTELGGLLPAAEADSAKWILAGASGHNIDAFEVVDTLLEAVEHVKEVGEAIPYVGALLKLVALAQDKEDQLSAALARALAELESQNRADAEIALANHLIGLVSPFRTAAEAVWSELNRINIEMAVGVARAQRFDAMLDIVDGLSNPLTEIRDQKWWVATLPNLHKGREFARHLLAFVRADGSLAPVVPDGDVRFDYRLGLPILLYTSTAYAAMLSSAMSWFRSAGGYALRFRNMATKVEEFVERMQAECLTRTYYRTAESVLDKTIIPLLDPAEGPNPKVFSFQSTGFEYIAVGAFDMVRYHDAFLIAEAKPLPTDLSWGYGPLNEKTGPRGLFNYKWMMTGTLDEVAASANEQARGDYARLQLVSGMFHLVRVAAWLRYLSTPPDRSETVSGRVRDTRSEKSTSPTRATSPSIHPVGIIEHDATLKKYDTYSLVSVKTQEPHYTPSFRYRVLLRMVDTRAAHDAWLDRPYVGGVWNARYEDIAGTRDKRLRTSFKNGAILWERELYVGPSPSELFQVEGEATIRAATFDWYVPQPPTLIPFHSPVADIFSKLSPARPVPPSGGKSIHLQKVDSVASAFENLNDYIGSVGESLDLAERRHVRHEDVTLAWRLSWHDGHLRISLEGQPDDRPFQVHVVLEERVYSGEAAPDGFGQLDERYVERIHTAFVAEVVNQLVFVPQAFFEKERAAIEEFERRSNDFIDRFAESRPVLPIGPIEAMRKEVFAMVSQSPSTATLAHTTDLRARLAAQLAPDLWEATERKFAASIERLSK